MQPPNLENLTLPGGIILNFDVGAGMRDLGEIVADSLQIEPKSTEYTFESQRSGKLRPAKIFSVKEEVSMKFKLVEPVLDNLRPFLKGGDITLVGQGMAAAADQRLTLSGELPASVGQYGISAVTVRQFLDKCLVYSGAAYGDKSAEADSLAGTPFDLLADPADFVYFGKATRFKELYLDLVVDGAYTGVAWEYWNGSTWTSLVVGGAGDGLDASGKVNWTPPADWAKTIANGSDPFYWVRVKCTAVTTLATCNGVRQNGVRNTDYVIDPGQVGGGLLTGRIGRLAAGFLADGEEVKVSFTYTTWESLKFPVATAEFQQGAARLDFSPAVGLSGKYHIPKCQLKPDGAISFDPKKELQLGMILEVLDDSPNHPDAPFGEWESPNES
ncbi:MAG: hypothetical protein ACYC6G_17235 [Desulfobaccales bacterium]